MTDATSSPYPAAPRLSLVEQLPEGCPADVTTSVADPYRWLEDDDAEATELWSRQQDELFYEQRERWRGRERVASRLRELLGAGVVGPPVWRGERCFFMRRTGEQEHGVLYVREQALPADPNAEPVERVLVDPMQLDPTGATTLDSWQPSKEGRLLAYQVSEGGSEESVLRVIDVTTGELVDGPIDRARYSPVAWLPGGEDYYYVRRLAPDQVPTGEQQYHRRVWFHRLGSDPAEDVEVFGSGRAITSYYGAAVSRDGRWLVVSAAEGTDPRNDVYLADLKADPPEAPTLRPVVEGLDARTDVHIGRDGRMYVATDLDAPRCRLAVGDPENPARENWRDLVAEREDAVMEDYALLDGPELGDSPVLLVSWTSHAVSQVTVHALVDGAQRGSLDLPGLGSIGALLARPEGGHEAWFTYTDNTTVPRVLQYDARDGEVSVFAVPPGTVEVPDVTTQQVAFESRDGTTVRMFVIARSDLLDDSGAPKAPAPTVLYGYGGFGVSLTPGYSATVLQWVEAGGVYAITNLRGGGEEGESWHRDGMLAVKQNVFDDFHAAADALVEAGWTTATQLAISGGSNGGLLVGAAMTQRPDAYAAVVCSAPLLDMVRYQRHGLGTSWTGEYGDAADPDALRWLHAYSPYHQVRDGVAYPATMFQVFDGDTRVDPLHARKMCAALQHATARSLDEAPILIRRESDVGHGARALSRTIELTTDTVTFLARYTGLEL
ncbi:MAG TPA: prolyl oligopeptidase family serine peptidase [Actinomycetales bacterium]|nr:prolyl oligopeptidase family serine peptidase [Actinomycetales bacterium]